MTDAREVVGHIEVPEFANHTKALGFGGTTKSEEVTNRDEVRASISAGGWAIVWGDLINEFDLLTFVISIPTGTVGGWVTEQIEAQLQKFSQSLASVSDHIIGQATDYLNGLLKANKSGERDINGLGLKAGFATYNRKSILTLLGKEVGRTKLPNNHQPYIALRVTKPLPLNGTLGLPTILRNNLGPVITLNNATIAEGDYLQSDNGLYRFICQGDGNIVLYGPEMSVIWKSSTDGKGRPPYRIIAQREGNIVQYDGNNTVLWKTETIQNKEVHGTCFMVLQDEGNLVLYRPGTPAVALWFTHIP